ncbi:YolD-like family protein [Peribacillus butanolivorans]|uniref:YolD-like family protein n=1 Tax=Peribacillus butanolivorans TaxID=421767 RepID=UPI0030C91B2D
MTEPWKCITQKHVKLLKNAKYDYYKSPRPLLDESQIEGMEQKLSESLENQSIIEIKTCKDGYFNSRVGIVQKIDPYTIKKSYN